jgi:hypothetical protein
MFLKPLKVLNFKISSISLVYALCFTQHWFSSGVPKIAAQTDALLFVKLNFKNMPTSLLPCGDVEKKTLWPESACELYLPSDHHLFANVEEILKFRCFKGLKKQVTTSVV